MKIWWGIIAQAIPLWMLVGVILSAWRHHIYWNPRPRPWRLEPAIVSGLFWIHRVSPLPITAYGSVLLVRNRTFWTYQDAVVGVAGAGLLSLAAEAVLTLWRAWRQELADPPLNRRRLWRDFRDDTRISGYVFLILPALAALPMLPWRQHPLLTVIGLTLVPVVITRLMMTRMRGTAFEMEPCPLHVELLEICACYAPHIPQIHIRPPTRSSSPVRVPLIVNNPSEGRLPKKVLMPAENFIWLDSDSLTAGLAWKLSRNVVPGTAMHADQGTVAFAMGCGCTTSLLLILALSAILQSIFSSFRVLPGTLLSKLLFGIAGALFITGTFAAIWMPFRWLGTFPTPYEAVRNAFRTWHAAEPGSDRMETDFFIAICEYQAFYYGIRNPELIVHQLSLAPGFHRFLLQMPEETRERALRAALARLRKAALPSA